MLAALVLAGALAGRPTPAPAPNPCAHRIFCGPIRLLPRSAVERRAFFADAALAVADALITEHNTRGNPADEANPAMRPFIRGGVGMILSVWAVQTIAERTISRRWSPQQRALLLDRDAVSHVSGVASWVSPATYGWSPGETNLTNSPPMETDWLIYDFCATTNGAPCAPEK